MQRHGTIRGLMIAEKSSIWPTRSLQNKNYLYQSFNFREVISQVKYQNFLNFRNIFEILSVPDIDKHCNILVRCCDCFWDNSRSCNYLFSVLGTYPIAPITIGMNLKSQFSYVICKFLVNGPQLSIFSLIFFPLFISAGQLNSIILSNLSIADTCVSLKKCPRYRVLKFLAKKIQYDLRWRIFFSCDTSKQFK